MKYVIYLRVSTDRQDNGIDAQRNACMEYIKRNNVGKLKFVEFIDEDISGSTKLEDREGLLNAMNALKKDDVLLVAKRDRIARGDPLLMATIEHAVERQKGKIISVSGEGTDSDDPSAILMRRMIDAFAEYERKIIAARTKAALAAKKRKGERVGRVPYGFQLAPNGIHLLICPQEDRIKEQFKEWRKNGMTLRQMERKAEELGFKNREGNRWQFRNILTVLRNLQISAPNFAESA